MKHSLSRLSVGANVVLLAVVVVTQLRSGPGARPGTPHPPPRDPAPRTERSPHRLAAPALAARGANHGLPSVDPAAVAQLESLGFTRDVIVAALLESFHHHWDEAFTALDAAYAPRPVPERAYLELARQRDAARLGILQAALGEAGYAAWHKDQTLRHLNVTGLPLSPDEAERAYQLQRAYDDEHRDLQMAMEDGLADPVEAATLQDAGRAWLDRQLEQLLGRDRFTALRGVADPVADVQRAYGDLSPNLDQARAVLAVERDYRAREAALVGPPGVGPADAGQLETELAALAVARSDQLRRIFGADAFDATQREQDPTYQKLRQFAGVWELDEPRLGATYATLRAIQDETARARQAARLAEQAGQRVDWPAVNAAIEQRRRRAEQDLQAVLGAKSLRRLQQNGLLADGG